MACNLRPLTVAALSLAAGLWLATPSLAQKGSGGGRGGGGGAHGSPGPSFSGRSWGGPSGQWRGGPGWGAGRRDWDDRRGFGGGWYGYGGGLDNWGWGGWGYPDWYDRPWYWDDYAFYRHGYPSLPPTIAVPGDLANVPSDDEADTAVRINVRVPADAEVWVEEEQTSQMGALRRFVSPPLDPAGTYTYTVRARWRDQGGEVERTRKAQVKAGDEITLSFLTSARDKRPESALPPPVPVH